MIKKQVFFWWRIQRIVLYFVNSNRTKTTCTINAVEPLQLSVPLATSHSHTYTYVVLFFEGVQCLCLIFFLWGFAQIFGSRGIEGRKRGKREPAARLEAALSLRAGGSGGEAPVWWWWWWNKGLCDVGGREAGFVVVECTLWRGTVQCDKNGKSKQHNFVAQWTCLWVVAIRGRAKVEFWASGGGVQYIRLQKSSYVTK